MAPSRTTGPLSVGIKSPDLSDLVADLKNVDRVLVNELRAGVRKAAEPVKRRAASNASFSTRIPGAVKIRASYPARGAAVTVYVDPKRAPHGAPLNNRGRSGTFRHRVFGQDVWVSQEAHPFFDQATADERAQVGRAIDQVVTTVLHKAGFH